MCLTMRFTRKRLTRMKYLIFFLCSLANICQALPQLEKLPLLGQPIRAVISETNPPPYAMFDSQGQLTDGIGKAIVDAIAADLRGVAQYQNIPRGRILEWLKTGQSDMACFLNPDWVDDPKAVDWSVPLLSSQQVIVRRRESDAVTKLTDLYGKRVGTTRGFYYPEFQTAFLQRQIIRDDAISLLSNLQRLGQGRLDAVLSVDLSLNFTLRHNPQFAGLFKADALWTEAPQLFCAISQSSPKRIQLLRLLSRLQAEGRLEQLITPYK